VDLFDVGPVTYPAYSGTDVNARAIELRSTMFPEGVPPSVLRLVPRFEVDLDDERTVILAEMDTRMRLAGFRPIG
jgi:hypothetical protein